MNIKIRKALPSDASILYHFICFLEEQSFDEKRFRENFSQCLEDENKLYLIAEKEDEVIGFISAHRLIILHRGGYVFEIQELFITRAYRDKGVAGLLLKALEEQASSTIHQGFSVCLRSGNTDGKRFYEKAGFQNSHIHLLKEI